MTYRMRWNEFRKFAEASGWVLARHGREHDIYRHPETRELIQIERHWSKEIKPGLVKRLLKQVRGE